MDSPKAVGRPACCALALLSAIALALYDRERTGKGRRVRTSLLANGAWANAVLIQAALCEAPAYAPPTRGASPNALVNHYRCADGRALYLVMVHEAAEWPRFITAIGRPELCDDPRFRELAVRRANATALVAILEAVFAAKALTEWRVTLDRHGVTFGIIARVADLPDDPQLNANGVFRPVAGDGVTPGLRTIDSPLHLDGAPKRPATRSPTIGEHGREILTSLGYSQDGIDQLVRDGVLRE